MHAYYLDSRTAFPEILWILEYDQRPPIRTNKNNSHWPRTRVISTIRTIRYFDRFYFRFISNSKYIQMYWLCIQNRLSKQIYCVPLIFVFYICTLSSPERFPNSESKTFRKRCSRNCNVICVLFVCFFFFLRKFSLLTIPPSGFV